ncbi:MAG TPA: hypothetical protein VFT46_04275 [Holophagaceae bacterium]|nr:hypothetical protein [Holophagaceae bacterium]
MQKPSTLPDDQRPGVTYRQAKEILASYGIEVSLRTLKRWRARHILTVKRVTGKTMILFRDEVEALAAAEDPKEQRLLNARRPKKRL